MKQKSEIAGQLVSLSAAAQALRNGHMILLCDSLFENYHVLCQAAQFASQATMEMAISDDSFSIALASERMDALHLLPMLASSEPLTVSLDHKNRVLGDERVLTIHALVDPRTQPEDLLSPGQIVVQRSHPGGTLARSGYDEAAVDLMRIAGLEPGAILYKVPALKDSGLEQTSAKMISVEAIARYRREHRVSFITETRLPTAEAIFRLRHYQEIATGLPYLALILGDLHAPQQPPPLLRLHSACMTGDVFGSQRCDCQSQLHAAMHTIAQEGRGILLYLPQEGRGIGLSAKLQAYVLQEHGYNTIEANEQLGYPVDARLYDSAIEVLHALDLPEVRLMTNNPQKIQAVEEGGITVIRVPIETPPTSNNAFYIQTKQQQLGHLFGVK